MTERTSRGEEETVAGGGRGRDWRGAGPGRGPAWGAGRKRKGAVVVVLAAMVVTSLLASVAAATPDGGVAGERVREAGSPAARMGNAATRVLRDRHESGPERRSAARSDGSRRAECLGCAGDDGALARLGWRLSSLTAPAVGEGD